ncbi:beta family protein [Motilibacter aurantiacus]|uniref:beta family protein n=1 Tax=Motilibacter aurantiacus TaxID=2714955 RepID=UPI00140AD9F2|nr:hypothetical protein [Motilibacter aurantiacus]NHC44351.1 hypothetical protein [Motilibacter aurantiacus]
MAYVPALKAREAEIKAVNRAPTTLQLTPLFELQRAGQATVDPLSGVRRRGKSTTTDASYFLDDIARLWYDPLYADISRVADTSNRAAWWRLLDSLNALASVPAELIPVLIPSDSAAVLSAAAGVASQTGRAALRVPMQEARSAPAALASAPQTVAKGVGVPVTSVDVILDWADGMEASVIPLDTLVNDTKAVIAALGGQHGSLITLGTPESSAFQQVGDWQPVRREWWLWLRLAHEGFDVVYGDYALYPPSDPVPASPRYGHLRYSSGDRMHVHRRAVPSTGGGLAAAFKVCCDHLVTQSHWLGAGLSRADQRLDDIAANSDKESQPGNWRQLAAEHHFALVADQLANPPAAPAPGTP